jgi:hypothetical protein
MELEAGNDFCAFSFSVAYSLGTGWLEHMTISLFVVASSLSS